MDAGDIWPTAPWCYTITASPSEQTGCPRDVPVSGVERVGRLAKTNYFTRGPATRDSCARPVTVSRSRLCQRQIGSLPSFDIRRRDAAHKALPWSVLYICAWLLGPRPCSRRPLADPLPGPAKVRSLGSLPQDGGKPTSYALEEVCRQEAGLGGRPPPEEDAATNTCLKDAAGS